MGKRTLISVAAMVAALAVGGCVDEGPGPVTPTVPTPPPAGLDLPEPSEVQAMDCQQIGPEVLEQLQALPHVTTAAANVSTTACLIPAPGGTADMISSPTFEVIVEGDVTADQIASTYAGIRAIYTAYITPIVDVPEIIRIDVDGVMEVEWQGSTPFDATLAQALLDVTGPDRYLAARLNAKTEDGGQTSVLGRSPDDSYLFLYVDGGTISSDAAATTALDSAWVDGQELAATFDAFAIVGMVDDTHVPAEDDGINPGPGRAQFLVDVPANDAMPSEFGPIALRTLDFADQPDLERSDIYLRSFQPFARLQPVANDDTISAESQTILDDITAQLQDIGYEFDFVHFF